MAQESGSRSLDKVIVRLPDGMRERIKTAAEKNNWSMNAEIVAALDLVFPEPEPFSFDQFFRDYIDPAVQASGSGALEGLVKRADLRIKMYDPAMGVWVEYTENDEMRVGFGYTALKHSKKKKPVKS